MLTFGMMLDQIVQICTRLTADTARMSLQQGSPNAEGDWIVNIAQATNCSNPVMQQ